MAARRGATSLQGAASESLQVRERCRTPSPSWVRCLLNRTLTPARRPSARPCVKRQKAEGLGGIIPSLFLPRAHRPRRLPSFSPFNFATCLFHRSTFRSTAPDRSSPRRSAATPPCHVRGHCRRCESQCSERRRVGLCRPRSRMKSVTAAAAADESESQRTSKKENSGVLGRRTRRVSAWPRRAPGTTSQRRTEFWRSMAARGDGNDEDLRSLGTGCVSNVDK